MSTEMTGTWVQHSDDLARDISNCIIDWERRNPGQRVKKVTFQLRDSDIEDLLAPHAHVQTTIRDKRASEF